MPGQSHLDRGNRLQIDGVFREQLESFDKEIPDPSLECVKQFATEWSAVFFSFCRGRCRPA